jgi:hypothetical protein
VQSRTDACAGHCGLIQTSVIHEADTTGAKTDVTHWMRFTLDTVCSHSWQVNHQRQPVFPEGFKHLAATCVASSASACSPKAGTVTRWSTSSAGGRSCCSCSANGYLVEACVAEATMSVRTANQSMRLESESSVEKNVANDASQHSPAAA